MDNGDRGTDADGRRDGAEKLVKGAESRGGKEAISIHRKGQGGRRDFVG